MPGRDSPARCCTAVRCWPWPSRPTAGCSLAPYPTIRWADQFGANVWTTPNIWNGVTGQWLGMLPTGSDLVRGLDVSGDGAVLAIAELDGAVSVWACAAIVASSWSGSMRAVSSVSPCPAMAGALVTTGAKGTARAWDVSAQRGREVLPGLATGTFGGLALTPKGDLVAVIEEGRTGARLRVLETADGKERAALSLPPRPLPPGWPGGEVLSRINIHMAGTQFCRPDPWMRAG